MDKYNVKGESEYSNIEFGSFDDMGSAMKLVVVLEGVQAMLDGIEHAEVPSYLFRVQHKDMQYFSDGSKSKIYNWGV